MVGAHSPRHSTVKDDRLRVQTVAAVEALRQACLDVKHRYNETSIMERYGRMAPAAAGAAQYMGRAWQRDKGVGRGSKAVDRCVRPGS